MSNITSRRNTTDEAGGSAETEVAARLALVIRRTPLDCECRLRLDEALARFVALEHRRMSRRHLVNARSQRGRIEALLVFLSELDELEATEPDHSVYMEIALLFDDIANAAREGAYAMRQLSLPTKSA